MEPPLIDVSDQIFNGLHRSIRFGITLMMWFGFITFVVDQVTTKPVLAHHEHRAPYVSFIDKT